MFYPLWLLYISAHMFIALWYYITFDIAALPALFAKVIIYSFMCRQSHVRKLDQTGATTRGSLGLKHDLTFLIYLPLNWLLFIELIFHKC